MLQAPLAQLLASILVTSATAQKDMTVQTHTVHKPIHLFQIGFSELEKQTNKKAGMFISNIPADIVMKQ